MLRALLTILLLFGSNTFMTIAWYSHLKKHGDAASLTLAALLPVALSAWMIALPEYLLQVPANRLGHVNFGGPLTAPQLKIIQEAITLVVFSIFSTLYLHERLRLQDVAAFGLIFLAVAIAMLGRDAPLAR